MSKSSPTAVSSGMRGQVKPGKRELDSLRIEIAENGFKVSKSTRPAKGQSSDCCGPYEPSKDFVFNSAADVCAWVEKELGVTDADEK